MNHPWKSAELYETGKDEYAILFVARNEMIAYLCKTRQEIEKIFYHTSLLHSAAEENHCYKMLKESFLLTIDKKINTFSFAANEYENRDLFLLYHCMNPTLKLRLQ